jgi:hypothetical protein
MPAFYRNKKELINTFISDSHVKLFLILTVVLGCLPFLVYFIERTLASLPTADAWYAMGTNHGPWRNGIEGLVIYYPLLALLVVTLAISISRSVKNKQWRLLGLGLLLAIIQIAFLGAQMYFLPWTID